MRVYYQETTGPENYQNPDDVDVVTEETVTVTRVSVDD